MGISVEKPEILVNPFSQMETALEHKLRNLKKRELRLQQLKTDKESGALKLDSKQIEALSKLDEVKLQIASIEDLQKVNAKQMKDFKKALKTYERQIIKTLKDARSQNSTPSELTESVQSQTPDDLLGKKEEVEGEKETVAVVTILKKEVVKEEVLV
ncbi:unnamed protein product [Meloidogyne enterolobii]|uniref:Uncharacterized protein n=2 Tax=Meloidogyne enterolobii TaxID=390850 RepID=A0ACB0ZXI9_MELEN|nr:unnamed protein product [Meloidogyne enterolobii]